MSTARTAEAVAAALVAGGTSQHTPALHGRDFERPFPAELFPEAPRKKRRGDQAAPTATPTNDQDFFGQLFGG